MNRSRSSRGAIVGCMVLGAISLCAAPAPATTTRWSSMQVPVGLGRDDASVEYFPTLADEISSGIYADPGLDRGYPCPPGICREESANLAPSSRVPRVLWIPPLRSPRLFLAARGSEEVRIGATGWRPGGVMIGIAGLYSHRFDQATEEYRLVTQSGPELRHGDRSTKRDLYYGILGWRAGDPGGTCLDGALGFGFDRRSIERRQIDSPREEILRTDPIDRPSWQATGLFTQPLRGGNLRALLGGGWERGEQDVKKYSIDGLDVAPGHRAAGPRTSSVYGDLAWMGQLGQVRLFCCGLSLTRTQMRDTDFPGPVVSIRQTTARRFQATAFAGAEVIPLPWLALRAGASKCYEDVRSSSELERSWPHASVSVNETDTSRGFRAPAVTTGIGLRHKKLRADLQLDLGTALSYMFNRASVSYEF